MSRYTWQVTVDDTTVLTNVQNIDISFGRRLRSDPWQANNATLQGNAPSSLPTIAIGTSVFIEAIWEGMTMFSYVGKVADFKINYGLIPNLDSWSMLLEDTIGILGRTTWTGSIVAKTAAYRSMIALGALVNIEFEQITGTPTYDGVPTQALTGDSTPVLDTLNQLCNTAQIALVDMGGGFMNYRSDSYVSSAPLVEFTDTTPVAASIAAEFNEIEIGALADTFASQVTVRPDGLAEQTVGTPPKSYVIPTYDSTTAHALSTATAVYATLDSTPNQPLTISCLAEQQSTNAAMRVCQWQGYTSYRTAANINFRGTKYTCVIEGGTISANPSTTRISFNLTKIPFNKFYFTLDSDEYGVLNTSQLGA